MRKNVSTNDRLAILLGGLIAALMTFVYFAYPSKTYLPDFRDYRAGDERKSAFFDYVRPLLEEERENIARDRQRLLVIVRDGGPGWFDGFWIDRLAAKYSVEDTETEAGLKQLVNRVDVVPVSLGLAQAAKESGWGTSRFALNGNNLFGEWCFEPGCGIVPAARTPGRSHEVRAFRSPADSVASYLLNINTHRGYRQFRRERARMRSNKEPLTGLALADELSQYSERRHDYVREIKSLIVRNNLDDWDDD